MLTKISSTISHNISASAATPIYFVAAATIAIAGLAGCGAATEAKLPPGRCMVSGECPQGEACRNTYCEDIYFPRRDIKPY